MIAVSIPALPNESGAVRDAVREDCVGAASSNHTISTIQSFQTTDLRAGSKEAISVGIFAGIIPLFRSLVILAVSQADS